MISKIPIVSFFTGGGFLDMGFEQVGFETVFTNEFDLDFAKLYEEGMISWALNEKINKQYKISSTESITNLSPSIIESFAFPKGKPKIWGIIGGPPCQDFTMNGNREGFIGDRGKMTIVFFNRIRKMEPSFFIMENVPGLVRNKKMNTILNEIVLKYCSENYYLDRFILNALDYGVPQNRERMFLVGLNKKLFLPPLKEETDTLYSLKFNKPKPLYENAKRKYKWPKMNAFGETPIKDKNIPFDLCIDNCLIKREDRINKIANIDEYFPFKKKIEERKLIMEGDTARQSFKRLHRYRYSPTTCYGNNEVHLHPYENRRLSVREALRIQGVPDSYVLPQSVSMTKKFKLIGNGVPVPLAKALAESLYEFILLYKI